MDLPPAPVYTDTRTIVIHPGTELQTIDGFGASDGWRCQMIGQNWPLEKRNRIADLLFSTQLDAQGNPEGIGLSVWRFYLGAGSMEQGPDSDISDEWRRAECFQDAKGMYDWQKQSGQRWFLQAAKERGVEQFLAFTLSPPVHMTVNGKAFSSQPVNMNIQEGRLPDYADFLVESIDNLQKKEGIKFSWLSPVNEPQWDWAAGTNGKASQEGTPATNQEIYELTALLSEKLKAKSLSTEIVLGEAGAINYLYQPVGSDDRSDQINAFWNPSSPLYVGEIPNVKKVMTGHSYHSVWPVRDQVEHRQRLQARTGQFQGLGYWQTEYCILEQPGETEIPGGSGNGRDLGMKTALFVARIIHNDLVVANASSWQWWTALTRADYKDGLIYLDDGSNNGGTASAYCRTDGYIRDSKLLWTLGNYSRFIRPGMVRIQVENPDPVVAATDLMVSAYKDTRSKQIVVVAINMNETEKTCKMDAPVKEGRLTPYITSEQMNLQKTEDVNSNEFTVPARSVVTYTGVLE